ncbi:MAG: ABC transporter ATP-binding protein [Candidatus Omnitrophica bacterium]|nr:ABC transporter ATP-binding protein [Candidatus Omnitrophota bacterium]
MPIAEFKNVHFRYPEGTRVFAGLDFSLERGEKVSLAGPNGSGKTTFFLILLGLLKAEAGHVVLWDRVMRAEADFREARKKIGFLFQDPDDQVFSPSVEEDVAFGPLNLGMGAHEARHTAEDAMRLLGILDLRERVPSKLSWGQKKLVALAGVLAMNPELLILDEPTAGVDDAHREVITRWLRETPQTCLIASHDAGLLADVAGRTHRLDG